jgi:hypothetical protein
MDADFDTVKDELVEVFNMGVITKEYTLKKLEKEQNKQLNINNTSEWVINSKQYNMKKIILQRLL